MPNEDHALREALEWYAEQVAGCRKLGHIGEPSRHALDGDGGERARAALSATPTQGADETAWLIEMIHNDAPVPRYWNPAKNKGWIWEVNDAIRFSREQDARNYLDGFQSPLGGKPVEHMWMAPTPAPIDNEALVETVKAAYIEGATDVHNYWAEVRPDVVPRGDPEFGEQASDYARAVLALPSIAANRRGQAVETASLTSENEANPGTPSALVEEAIGALEWALPLAAIYMGIVGGERAKAGHHVGEYGLYDSERADRDNARTTLAKLKEGRA